MADIRPFHAVRYDTSRVRLEQVLTQPYDKITSEMQTDYYNSSPHNLVRLELGKPEPGDGPNGNAYTRASFFLQEKRTEGILIRDAEPSIYAYSQSFELPASPSTRIERHGFIGLCRLQDYADEVVYRHEQTLAKPKADRLDLLRATRTHSGQIFMVYSDPARSVDTLLERVRSTQPMTASMRDEYGVSHTLWRITDVATIEQVQSLMRDQRLIIADGHHRYETALAYRSERQATAGNREATADNSDPASHDYVMATLINMDAPGLVILPTHRVVFGLPRFNAEDFLEAVGRYFEIEALPAAATAETALNTLAAVGAARTCFIAIMPGSGFLFKARTEAIDTALPDASEHQRSVDVTQLHNIVLERLLGISEEDMRNQTHISYLRSAKEAIQRVYSGANVAFLMNPVRLEQFREIAFANQVMPQKSTDFYPKLMSGITLYALD